MPPQGHDAAWPDKLVFAALLLIVAGALGLLYGMLLLTGATLGDKIPGFFRAYPTWIVLAGSAIALVAGVLGFRHQTSRACWVGAVGSIASMAFLGIVPALGAVAVIMLVWSAAEGEETVYDAHRVEAHEWPDKAIMASLFLTVGAVAALGQAVLLWAGASFEAPVATAFVWAIVSIGCAGLMVAGAVSSFRLRGGVLALIGAAACIATLSFWIVGPLFGLLALLMTALAYREGEYLLHGAAAS